MAGAGEKMVTFSHGSYLEGGERNASFGCSVHTQVICATPCIVYMYCRSGCARCDSMGNNAYQRQQNALF